MALSERHSRNALLQISGTQSRQIATHELGIMKDAQDTLQRILSILERQGTGAPDLSSGIDFYQEVERFEIVLIQKALELAAGNQKRAASFLGLRPNTLNSKIKSYQIKWKVFGSLVTWRRNGGKYKQRRRAIGD
jgi:transcriptional regulator with GAF, ATPase, and Fis domain